MDDPPQEPRTEPAFQSDPTAQSAGELPHSLSTEKELKICMMEEKADRLFRLSKYEEAFDVLETIRSMQPDTLRIVMRASECLIFMDDFGDAFNFYMKSLRPMILKKPRPDPKALIEESQRWHQDEMLFRSLVFIWLACTLYQVQSPTQESLEGILECMHIMEELLVNVYKKCGIFEDFNSERFGQCKRFGDFHGKNLYSLTGSKMPKDTELESLFKKVHLGCTTALASCFVILEDFKKSLYFFREYDGLIKDEDGPRDLKYCFGQYVANIALSLQQLTNNEDLESRAKRISSVNQSVADYKATGENDDLSKKEMLRSIDDVAATTANVQQTVQDMIYKLVTIFIKSLVHSFPHRRIRIQLEST